MTSLKKAKFVNITKLDFIISENVLNFSQICPKQALKYTRPNGNPELERMRWVGERGVGQIIIKRVSNCERGGKDIISIWLHI